MVCHFLLFNFLCSAVCSVTTVNNIQDKSSEGAEQGDPSNRNESMGELLNNVRLTEEELKELYDAINSTLKATGLDGVTFPEVEAVKDIAMVVISQRRQDLDMTSRSWTALSTPWTKKRRPLMKRRSP